jgi:hypothetical protein
MLVSPQVLRVPNAQIECTSFQMLCTSLSKRRRHGMLGLRHFCEHGYVMGSVDKTLFTLNHGTEFYLFRFTWMISILVALLTLLCPDFRK